MEYHDKRSLELPTDGMLEFDFDFGIVALNCCGCCIGIPSGGGCDANRPPSTGGAAEQIELV